MAANEDESKASGQTKTLSNTDLEQLSQDPSNVVYKYEYDASAVDTTLNASKCRELVGNIRQAFLNIRTTKPLMSDDDIRNWFCFTNWLWRGFAESHPSIFEKITNRNTDIYKMNIILYILLMQHQVETGKMTKKEGDKRVQEYVLKNLKKIPKST